MKELEENLEPKEKINWARIINVAIKILQAVIAGIAGGTISQL